MNENSEPEWEIEIYHNGVVMHAPIRGKSRFLAERSFLDKLVGYKFPDNSPPRPVPDPQTDYYQLNDEQIEAYSEFRKQFSKS